MVDRTNIILISATFNEGKSAQIIDEIAKAVLSVERITLIEVDPNKNYHRTNIIFGGPPQAVMKAAHLVVKNALEHIDLKFHPHSDTVLGAMETISFIPLHTDYLEKCEEMARTFGAQIAREFKIPVFLFGELAISPERKDISHYRQIGFNKLTKVLKQPEWKPDFGPARRHPRGGIVLVGARSFSVNLAIYFDTEDVELISELTKLYQRFTVHQGQMKQDHTRELTRYEKISRLLGKIKMAVSEKPSLKLVSLICNIPDYRETSLYYVVETFQQEANKLGIGVFGNRIYGYIPAEVLLKAGEEYCKEHLIDKIETPENCLNMVVKYLKLSAVEPFDMKRQVLDYHFEI